MEEGVLLYGITEIPDPLDAEHQLAADGDVLAAASKEFEHLLRAVANMMPQTVSVAIRFLFEPKPSAIEMQSRLKLFLLARSNNPQMTEVLRLLIERGALKRFYSTETVQEFEAPWEALHAGCEVVRREDAVDPLHSEEYNPHIPEYYYTIRSFDPNERNDYIALDRVLGDIQEPTLINICVEPADISKELWNHTRYLAQLQSINRAWDRDEEGLPPQDWLGGETNYHPTFHHDLIKPLRYKDPLADDILRSQQRFHETLRQPHLLFHVQVMARTPAVAHLLASVVAECAFEKGSYRLLPSNNKEGCLQEAFASIREFRALEVPTHKYQFQNRNADLYQNLARLSDVATVEELSGLFRLPIGSFTSPRTMRMNTDPPNQVGGNLITVGVDKELPGMPRGAGVESVPKHWFASGVTGSSKTNFTLNLLMQLHTYSVPFLVLETAKTEYRILKTLQNAHDKNARALAEALEIYTPGNETISKFRYNPLWRPEGISVDGHIDEILKCLLAAMPVEGPLPALIGEALERVYEYYPDPGDPPLMADLLAAAHQVSNEKSYSPQTKDDIRTALKVSTTTLCFMNRQRCYFYR